MDLKKWVFDVAEGNYDIDLGDSNAPCKNFKQLNYNGDALLDYGVDRGKKSLRKEVSKLYHCEEDEIIITHGAQEGLFLLYFLQLNHGDEVISIFPGWPQANEAPKKLGARSIQINNLPNGRLDVKSISDKITVRTKIIVLNSPNNPTTDEVNVQDIQELIELVRGTNIFLVLDDEYLVDLKTSFSNLYLRSASVSSISKIYGFPGLRVGWVKAEKKVIEKLRELKHLTTISNSVICEELALEVLKDKERYLSEYMMMWRVGNKIILEWVSRHPTFFENCKTSQAPFAWIRISKNVNAIDFCHNILDSEAVLLMPSDAFGVRQHIRVTFVRKEKELRTALNKISSLIESYKMVNRDE